MSAIEKNYTVKILILFLATFAGIFVIWYSLVREESVDWLSSQISHQVSPYAITETEKGLIISNVVLGYGFDLPQGFKSFGSKNLSFFMEEAGGKKCEIKHYYLNADKAGKLSGDEGRLIISWRKQKLVFELVNKAETNICKKYLEEIRWSLAEN